MIPVIAKIKNCFTPLRFGRAFRKNIRNKYDRLRLRNRDFSIICSNCIGGVISHDLGQEFMSPTVNLYIPANDFVRFIGDLPFYLGQELVFKDAGELTYPVAMLGDIPIYFMHYRTVDEAREKWNERKKRVDFDNLFIVMTDRDGCTPETLERFDALNFKNKVCFTAKKHPGLKSTYHLSEYENDPEVGIMTDIVNIFGKRAYQQSGFDYVKFLNGK